MVNGRHVVLFCLFPRHLHSHTHVLSLFLAKQQMRIIITLSHDPIRIKNLLLDDTLGHI